MRAFREVLENRDREGLFALMAEDVVFRSPAVYAPYEGRDKIAALLNTVGEVLKDWRCERELGAEDASDQGVVFRARVGDREVEGCDFIHLNDEGLIDEFYVMVRPLSALLALAEAMSKELGLDGDQPALHEQGD